jgi:hypothetical protein
MIIVALLACAIGAGLNQYFTKTAHPEALTAFELVPK